jgi:DNA replication protein DnaC
MKQVFPYYQEKSLDDFEATTPELERAVEVTRDYIDNLKAMKDEGKGITFVGPNGVGKTHLACAMMAAAGDAGYRIECIELSSYVDMYMESFRLNARINKFGYDEDGQQSYQLDERLRYVERRSQFLLLDDLGRETESRSGWSNHQVFNLLRYRHNRNMSTIVTTNLSFPELDEQYTPGLSSFLREATALIVMEGEDHRCAVGK